MEKIIKKFCIFRKFTHGDQPASPTGTNHSEKAGNSLGYCWGGDEEEAQMQRPHQDFATHLGTVPKDEVSGAQT